MKNKKLTAIFVCIAVFSTFGLNAFAAEKDTTQNSIGIIWNQSTGEVTQYDPSTFKNEEIIPIKAEKLPTSKNSKSSVIGRGISLPVLDHYSETSESLNWTQKYVGVTRVDNSGNQYTGASIIFTATSTDSWSASGTYGTEVSAEMDLIVAKVNVTSSLQATVTRSWTNGTQYGTSTTVPAKTIGKITAYIPGTSSSGYACYKVYNTSDSSYYWNNIPKGAIVPANNAWNLVITIPCT